MKRLSLTAACLILLCLGSQADNQQTVIINGKTMDKAVARLTFSGDNVTLYYNDDTRETIDMELVTINLYNDGSGVDKVKSDTKGTMSGHVFNLNGQRLGNNTNGLPKGVYIVDGKKIVIR